LRAEGNAIFNLPMPVPAVKPEKVFLVVSLIFWILFCLVTPPFQVVDEDAHFYRAYQVSEGGILAERGWKTVGGFLPKSLKEAVTATKGLPVTRK